jgi:type I restriction enzyme, S subunit
VSEFDIPESWVMTSIDDVAAKGEQRIPKDDESFIYIDIGSVDRNLKVIAEPQYLVGKSAPSRARKIVNAGDVLVSLTRPNLNAVAHIDKQYDDQIASTGFEVIKPLINSKFIFGLVRSRNFIESISEKVQGALYPAAKSTDVRRFEFGLPPLAEQQQIAQKLDELLAQVDTLKTRLDAIPNILKRFRQSVLAAAVSGRLTEEWRGVQVEKLDEWRWVTLGEIADVKGGITKDSKKQESSFVELPYLRVANVQRYYLDLTEIKTIRIPESRVKDLLLEDGDILFNEGGDLDKLGRGWIWEGQIQNCSFQNHVFRARLKDKSDNPKYISWWGNTEGLEYFIRNGKQTTNLASINKTLLSNLPINLPPAKEQTEIVRRVEQLFAYADQIEQRVKDAQARVNHLTQSILAKAFRGELTADWRAQNPELISGENSAAALLERIKVEREAIAKPKRKVKV